MVSPVIGAASYLEIHRLVLIRILVDQWLKNISPLFIRLLERDLYGRKTIAKAIQVSMHSERSATVDRDNLINTVAKEKTSIEY